jgi:hypothetical protein
MDDSTTQPPPAMQAEPQQQHRWLQQLVGDWVWESGVPAEPGKPAETVTGKETVRSIGDIWFIAEGRGEKPGGGEARTMMTLGYDPQDQRFVGTWIGSMMHHLWVYDGELDDAGKVLTLHAVGPDFQAPGRTRQYRDIIEIEDADHRLLTGLMLGHDGEWQELMQTRYRRA